MKDYGMKFEKVVNHFIGIPPKEAWWANYYTRKKDALSILYTICAKEIMINNSQYSKEAIDELYDFQERLSKEDVLNNNINIIIETIDYLEKLTK